MTGSLQLVGAGLPRTGTASLTAALERLLGGPCYHMSAIPGHPFDLGVHWGAALAGGSPPWGEVFVGFAAAVDWPASMFWHELSTAYPDAPVLLSTRASADVWWQSMDATVLPAARRGTPRGADDRDDLLRLFERFTATSNWDEPDALMSAYERHNAEVRRVVSPTRLVEWRPGDGWEAICRRLGVPVPDEPFPWVNKREDWG